MLLLAALADPTRRAIVELLADGAVGAGEIAARFPVSRPAVSRHLRLLREAGLVESEVDGQRRTYRLDRSPLAELDAWLGRFRPFGTEAASPELAPPELAPPELAPPEPAPSELAPPDRAPAGPAGRLDALDTEVRRGHRERRARPVADTTRDTRPEESDDDRSAG